MGRCCRAEAGKAASNVVRPCQFQLGHLGVSERFLGSRIADVCSSLFHSFILMVRFLNRIIQPNTPYRFLTLEDSICQVGGFYHISTIIPSCVGVMQTFVYGRSQCDHGHFQASRMLLGRILIYLHQEICRRNAFVQECEPPKSIIQKSTY